MAAAKLAAAEKKKDTDSDTEDDDAEAGSFRPAPGTAGSFHSASKLHAFPSQQGFNKAPRFASPYF